MTVHQHDSSQPQQSQDSPQPKGLGFTMVEMVDAVLAGIMARMLDLRYDVNAIKIRISLPVDSLWEESAFELAVWRSRESR
jgi:hypothetical protein